MHSGSKRDDIKQVISWKMMVTCHLGVEHQYLDYMYSLHMYHKEGEQ